MATGAFAFCDLKTNRGCHWFKDWYFLCWHPRQICHIHMAMRKVGDQAQRLVDAFGKLDPRLLQSPCINGRYTAKEKSITIVMPAAKTFEDRVLLSVFIAFPRFFIFV